jgi:cob(I)alamin adenosyltransferase
MKTFNKKGDQGETSLLYGERVPKSHPRCEAYGTIDEAVSALGLARALTQNKKIQDILFQVQKALFIPAAEMAIPEENYLTYAQKNQVVTEEMVQQLEDVINELESITEMPKAFIIPGASISAAALDLARCMVRKAERRAVRLKEDNLLPNENILKYLNRLADMLFTLARYEEAELKEN